MSDTVRFVHQPSLVELGGDIDLANAQAIADALCEAIDRTSVGLLVDVSAVPFMDSCAMAMLIRVHMHALESGCSVTWRGFQPAPARVIEITGLSNLLLVESDTA
jgi:anti-sigma B factor antagonist